MERDFRTLENGTETFALAGKVRRFQKALSDVFSENSVKNRGIRLVRILPLVFLAGTGVYAAGHQPVTISTYGAVQASEYKVTSSADRSKHAYITYDDSKGRVMIEVPASAAPAGAATVEDGITVGDGTNAVKHNVENGRINIIGDDKNIKTELVDEGNGSSRLKISYIGEAGAGTGTGTGTGGGATCTSCSRVYIDARDNHQSITIDQGNVNVGGNRIQNVGDAKEAGDAVNLGQLNKATQNLSSEITHINRQARAGIAQAIATAGLPQVYIPGRSMLTAAAGTYRGQSGFALGLSHATDNSKWVFKGSASADTHGGFGGSVGAGYQF